MTYAKHFLDIYDVDLRLATTLPQWQQLVDEKFPITKRPGAAGISQFLTWKPRKGITQPVIILWIGVAQHTSPTELVNTVAHEAAHAAGQILEHVGHEGLGGDEPRAYLTGWLASWMWDHLPARARGIGNTAS